MNKKYSIYSALMMLLMVNNQSFSMHQVIFYGAKAVGKGALPLLGGALAYHQGSNYKKFHQGVDVSNNDNDLKSAIENAPKLLLGGIKVAYQPIPVVVQKWMRKEMERFGVADAQTIPIVPARCGGAAIAVDKILLVDPKQAEKLHSALQNRIDGSDKIIAENSMLLGHEINHYTNQDSKKQFCSFFLTPLTVEAMCLSATYAFNKSFGIQAPKTFVKTALRSSIAVGSVVPKFGLSVLGVVLYQRYQEKEADKFACENAQTRLELEAFHDFFQKRADEFEKKIKFSANESEFIKKTCYRLKATKFDLVHPYVGDRTEMVQKYIDEWDKNHKDENNNE